MPLAMMLTTQGVAMTPTKVTSMSTAVNTKATRSMSCCVASADWVFLTSPKMGTKACAKAPSAKSRRNKLGMRKATQKARSEERRVGKEGGARRSAEKKKKGKRDAT